MNELSLGEKIGLWGEQNENVRVMLLIGSRARKAGHLNSADKWSDWDFQIVAADTRKFENGDWARDAGLSPPIVYANKLGRLGHTNKVSAIFPEGDLDLVLIPAWQLIVLRWLWRTRVIQYLPRAQGALRDLALVLRSGHQVLKGEPQWRCFFDTVVVGAPFETLDRKAIIEIAENYVCEYASAYSKIQRGEYLAAQRWLHVNLGEANFRLLHEHNMRKGLDSFPDARRVEMMGENFVRDSISISAIPDKESLSMALEKNAQGFCALVKELVGDDWQWPNLPSRLRGE